MLSGPANVARRLLGAGASDVTLRSLPWGTIVVWAVIGTALGLALVLMDLRSSSATTGGWHGPSRRSRPAVGGHEAREVSGAAGAEAAATAES